MAHDANMLSKMVQKAVILACWLAVLARLLVIVALIGMLIALVNVEAWSLFYVVLVSLVVIVSSGYLVLAMTLRCPACRRRFLIERRAPTHDAARKAQYFDYWGTMVLDVIRRREFTCMYCGTISSLR